MAEPVEVIRLDDDGIPEVNVTDAPGVVLLTEDGLYVAEVGLIEEVEDGVLLPVSLSATLYGDPDAVSRVTGIRAESRVSDRIKTATRVEPTVGIVAKVEEM